MTTTPSKFPAGTCPYCGAAFVQDDYIANLFACGTGWDGAGETVSLCPAGQAAEQGCPQSNEDWQDPSLSQFLRRFGRHLWLDIYPYNMVQAVQKRRRNLNPDDDPPDPILVGGCEYICEADEDTGDRSVKVHGNREAVVYLRRQACLTLSEWLITANRWMCREEEIIAVSHPGATIRAFKEWLDTFGLKHHLGRNDGKEAVVNPEEGFVIVHVPALHGRWRFRNGAFYDLSVNVPALVQAPATQAAAARPEPKRP